MHRLTWLHTWHFPHGLQWGGHYWWLPARSINIRYRLREAVSTRQRTRNKIDYSDQCNAARTGQFFWKFSIITGVTFMQTGNRAITCWKFLSKRNQNLIFADSVFRQNRPSTAEQHRFGFLAKEGRDHRRLCVKFSGLAKSGGWRQPCSTYAAPPR